MNHTIVITGITSGIGLETARKLNEMGHRVIGLIRNTDRAKELKDEGQLPKEIEYIHCDLAELSSVHKAAQNLKEQLDSIDVLINNAGGIFTKRETTKDGFEKTFGVNHLGHFALTLSVMDLLLPGGARIINVSSEAHRYGNLNFEDLQAESKYHSWKTYGDGKLCNIYFTRELHRRYNDKGLSSFALHPGVVKTNFFSPVRGLLGMLVKVFSFLMISPEKGAATSVFLATDQQIDRESGKYFKNKKVKTPSSKARDDQKANKLWEVSEQLLRKTDYPL